MCILLMNACVNTWGVCHHATSRCRIWNYHWRLWTIPEATELLLAAGFDAVHTWLRPMRQTGTGKVRSML